MHVRLKCFMSWRHLVTCNRTTFPFTYISNATQIHTEIQAALYKRLKVSYGAPLA